jgi:zinc protease
MRAIAQPLTSAALALTALCAAGDASAQPRAPAPEPTPTPAPAPRRAAAPASSLDLARWLPAVETWTLDNGLTVAYLGVHKAPVASVQLWYHAGSKDERRDRRGSAHMFEHMMFKGTAHVRPEEHARHINRLGGAIGAFTLQDATTYVNTVPREYVGFACQLEAERMRNLMFRDDMIATEREVVKEEIRMRVDNQPVARAFSRLLELAFTKHPYGWSPAGVVADLDATTAADLRAFYDTYYVPNNALLVVVGDVSVDDARACADRWFAAIPRGADPPRPSAAAAEPPQTEPRRAQLEPLQNGFVFAGYHVPPAKHADIYPLRVLERLLGAGESSRLARRLVRGEERLAVGAGAELLALEEPGLFLALAVYTDAAMSERVEEALLDELAALQRAAPSAAEVQKAKRQLAAQAVLGLEGVAGLAQQIGQSWILAGDPRHFLATPAKYDAVTPADVQRVAREYLTDGNRTMIVIPPRGAGGGR